jgi:hypothetical protein
LNEPREKFREQSKKLFNIMIEAPVLSPVYISEFEKVSEIHRHKTIYRLLIGGTFKPCFGGIVMLPASA